MKVFFTFMTKNYTMVNFKMEKSMVWESKFTLNKRVKPKENLNKEQKLVNFQCKKVIRSLLVFYLTDSIMVRADLHLKTEYMRVYSKTGRKMGMENNIILKLESG